MQKHHSICQRLEESQVEDWAWRRGAFATSAISDNHKIDGGLRLLFVQPRSDKQIFAVPQKLISGKIGEALKLPACTFVSFQQPSGMTSCHTYPEGGRGEDYTQLCKCECAQYHTRANIYEALVFRTPQKWECSIGGVAITHDFESGITTGLNVGYAFMLDHHQAKADRLGLSSPLTAFLEQVRNAQKHWAHPLLLPCLFLTTHVQRVRTYLHGTINRDVVQIERCVGVTTAGRSQSFLYDLQGSSRNTAQEQLFVNGQMQRAYARELIAKINDISTWIVFAKRSPQWDIDCIDLVLNILNNSTKLRTYRGSSDKVFRETLAYIRSYSEACREITLSSEARMQLQLNIVCFVPQHVPISR